MLAIEGEQAIFKATVPDFDRVATGFTKQKAEQLSLYNARMQANEAQRTVLSAQKAQRESEVNRLSAQFIALRRDEKFAEEELALKSDLLNRKLTTRDRFYGAQRDAADRQKQRMNARDQLARAESELLEFERKLTEFETRVTGGSSRIDREEHGRACRDQCRIEKRSRAARADSISPRRSTELCRVLRSKRSMPSSSPVKR